MQPNVRSYCIKKPVMIFDNPQSYQQSVISIIWAQYFAIFMLRVIVVFQIQILLMRPGAATLRWTLSIKSI